MKRGGESVKEWFSFAKEDFKLASLGLESGIIPELLCFHAQQSVEKAIKALLLQYDQDFPKTHNIQILLSQLSFFIEIPDQVMRAETLTDYAVTTRYPGIYEKISEDEYKNVIRLSSELMNWAEAIIIDA